MSNVPTLAEPVTSNVVVNGPWAREAVVVLPEGTPFDQFVERLQLPSPPIHELVAAPANCAESKLAPANEARQSARTLPDLDILIVTFKSLYEN